MKYAYYVFVVFLFLMGGRLAAQDEPYKPSKTQFMIRGYGHTGYNSSWSADGENKKTFIGNAFAPIFLFTHNDRFIIETELEFILEDKGLEIGFEYSNMSYILNKYMTIRAGKFLLPFGTFMEKLHPAWINRLNYKPLGFGHGGIAPASGIGIELRGAFQAGTGKFNYSVYTTNGPVLNDGIEEPEEAGQLIFDNFLDNNENKALGGRLGWFPFINSSLELGASVYYAGNVGNQGSVYDGVGAQLYSFDLSYVKQISSLRGVLDIKGQYNQTNVDDATYFDLEEGDTIPKAYTFKNKSNAYYGQLAYRPTMASSTFLKNIEFVYRYSTLRTPEGAEWEEESKQSNFGLNYWISWRNVIKISYQKTDKQGGHDALPDEINTTNGFSIHWSVGF